MRSPQHTATFSHALHDAFDSFVLKDWFHLRPFFLHLCEVRVVSLSLVLTQTLREQYRDTAHRDLSLTITDYNSTIRVLWQESFDQHRACLFEAALKGEAGFLHLRSSRSLPRKSLTIDNNCFCRSFKKLKFKILKSVFKTSGLKSYLKRTLFSFHNCFKTMCQLLQGKRTHLYPWSLFSQARNVLMSYKCSLCAWKYYRWLSALTLTP